MSSFAHTREPHALGMVCAVTAALALTPMATSAQESGQDVVDRFAPAAKGLFAPMGKPRPGDWLAVFAESGQTPEEYARDLVNRFGPRRRALVLLPVGELTDADRKLIDATRDFARAFFWGCDVRLAAPTAPPSGAWQLGRQQFDAGLLLDFVATRVPDDALALAAILPTKDLFVEDLNFVFGVGSEGRRAGVYSLARFGQGKARLRRTLATMSHEIGHILGIAHCVHFECLMNGSNSLAESDRRPIFLCPVCEAKLASNLRWDARDRLEAMRDVLVRIGLPDEAAFAVRLLERRATGTGRGHGAARPQ